MNSLIRKLGDHYSFHSESKELELVAPETNAFCRGAQIIAEARLNGFEFIDIIIPTFDSA